MKLAQTSAQAPAQAPAQILPQPAGQEGPATSAPLDPAALLETLRDIQMPAEIPWWPPALGWWLLFGAALLGYLAWRYEWHTRWRRTSRIAPPVAADTAAFRELERVRAAFAADGDVKALAVALSVLLRRVAMESVSRDQAAALTGEPWLEWLDAQVGGNTFSAGLGHALVDAPYRAPADVADQVDGDALLQICEKWIMQMFHANVSNDAARG